MAKDLAILNEAWEKHKKINPKADYFTFLAGWDASAYGDKADSLNPLANLKDEGKGEPPKYSYPENSGQFAYQYNRLSVEHRNEWLQALINSNMVAQACMIQDHATGLELLNQASLKLSAIRSVHYQEEFGPDCVEDGDPYPCMTVKILDGEVTIMTAEEVEAMRKHGEDQTNGS